MPRGLLRVRARVLGGLRRAAARRRREPLHRLVVALARESGAHEPVPDAQVSCVVHDVLGVREFRKVDEGEASGLPRFGVPQHAYRLGFLVLLLLGYRRGTKSSWEVSRGTGKS
uniref:Uncharacterized protein n=1 Tax=Phaeomonas parva TaxID=124430 RepID=A0A6U4JSW5_9STRA